MVRELRILILEDVPTDAELAINELVNAGITFTSRCVTTREDFIRELNEFSPRIVLSDYSLPAFDGLSALKIATEKFPDIPFIFVSGALGEERAIEMLKQGATDYVLKDRLSRLAPAVSRALQEARDRCERKRAEQALKESEVRYRMKSEDLEEANTALKVLLKHREEDKATQEEQVLANVKKLVFPYLTELKQTKLDNAQMAHVEIIEEHLRDIVSPFLRTLSSSFLNLTPREIQIATLVKDGRTTKEITDLLNISATAIDFHRKNLRSKFGIKNKSTNLRTYLASLSVQ